jgi:hypothetical protein
VLYKGSTLAAALGHIQQCYGFTKTLLCRSNMPKIFTGPTSGYWGQVCGQKLKLSCSFRYGQKSFQTVFGFAHTLLLLKSNLNVQQPGLRPEAGWLTKSSSFAAALGVTKII